MTKITEQQLSEAVEWAGGTINDSRVMPDGWLHNAARVLLWLAGERDEVAVVADQRGCPTFVGHLAAAVPAVTRLPYGIYHVAASGDCTWADFAEAIFQEAGVACRVRRIASTDYPTPVERPAYSVLRSERGAPVLPHWRDGLRECMAQIGR